MTKETQLLTAAFVVGFAATSLFAEATRKTSESLPPGHEVFALYEAGKLPEARAALAEFVKEQATAGAAIDVQSPIDAEGKLGVSVAVDVVLNCFSLEQKYGSPSKELFQASRDARAAADKAVKEVSGKFTDSDRVSQGIKYCNRMNATLLAKEIVALRNEGQLEQANALVKQNAAFLADQGVPVENLLPTVKTVPTVSTNAVPEDMDESIGPGAALPLCQLILAYYQALAAENVEALDKCLVLGPEFLDGKALVKRISEERTNKRNFDVIGPVVFDNETTLQVVPATEGKLRVDCRNIVKTFVLRGKSFTQRESDPFTVRLVDGMYRIEKAKRGK